MDYEAVSTRLLSAVLDRCGPDAAEWLSTAARRRDFELSGAFAAVSRRVGRIPLGLSATEAEFLGHAGLSWPTQAWGVDDAARAALLVSRVARLSDPRAVSLVEDLYRLGDSRERSALARALPLLRRPAQYLGLAREAARSELPPVFFAIACDNPYPSRHFPEEALHQLTLRVEALGLPKSRVLGVERRRALGFEALVGGGAAR